MPTKFTAFADYLVDYYLTKNSQFSPEVWAIRDRTTNGCESFHAAFKNFFLTAHPHIFAFVDALLKLTTL